MAHWLVALTPMAMRGEFAPPLAKMTAYWSAVPTWSSRTTAARDRPALALPNASMVPVAFDVDSRSSTASNTR